MRKELVTVKETTQLRRQVDDETGIPPRELRKVFAPGQHVDTDEWVLPDRLKQVIVTETDDPPQPVPSPVFGQPVAEEGSTTTPMPAPEPEVEEVMEPSALASPIEGLDVVGSDLAQIEAAMAQMEIEEWPAAAQWVIDQETARTDGVTPRKAILDKMTAHLS